MEVLPIEELSKEGSCITHLPVQFMLTNKDDSGKTLMAKAYEEHRGPDVALLRTDPQLTPLGSTWSCYASIKWALQFGDVSGELGQCGLVCSL